MSNGSINSRKSDKYEVGDILVLKSISESIPLFYEVKDITEKYIILFSAQPDFETFTDCFDDDKNEAFIAFEKDKLNAEILNNEEK